MRRNASCQDLSEIGTVVTPRDLTILRALVVTRVLDSSQVATVGSFVSLRRTNRRLLKLANAGLLRRWFVGTERHGVKAIYGLSPKGAALIGEGSQAVLPWKAEQVITSSSFLAHQQGINAVFLQVRFRRLPAELSCERWSNFREPLSTSIPLIPDGYVELKRAGTLHRMFLEVDLGTETSKVWKAKVELYLKLAISGEFGRIFQGERFRVLVLLHSSRRLEIVRRTIASRTDKLFWLSTQDQVRSEGLFAPIWLRPKGEDRMPLV